MYWEMMGKTKRVKDRQAERRGTDCTNASDAGLSTQIQTNLVQSFLSISTQSFQMILFFSRDYFSSLPTHPVVCLSENSFSRLTTSHLYSDIILVHRFIFFPFFFIFLRNFTDSSFPSSPRVLLFFFLGCASQ